MFIEVYNISRLSTAYTADCRLHTTKIAFPFISPGANCKQADMHAIQVTLSDIQADRSA